MFNTRQMAYEGGFSNLLRKFQNVTIVPRKLFNKKKKKDAKLLCFGAMHIQAC